MVYHSHTMKGLKDGGRGRSLESFEKVFLFFFSFFLSSKRPFRADYFGAKNNVIKISKKKKKKKKKSFWKAKQMFAQVQIKKKIFAEGDDVPARRRFLCFLHFPPLQSIKISLHKTNPLSF